MLKRAKDKLRIEKLFVFVGFSIITLAGLYLAATAHAVTRFDAWVVAYLVLIVGIAQIAIGKGIALFHNRPLFQPALMVFIAFNAANLLVIFGRLFEVAWLVFVGSAGVIAAMLLVVVLTRGNKPSCGLTGLYVVVVAVALGSLAGSVLTVL